MLSHVEGLGWSCLKHPFARALYNIIDYGLLYVECYNTPSASIEPLYASP